MTGATRSPASERAEVGGLAVTRRRPIEHDAPTVVLVHGTMDRAASFARVVRRLGDLDTVAFDRRGYAGSGGLAATDDLDVHATDVIEVLRWSGPSAAIVVGHSFGGLVALRAAQLLESGEHEAPAPLVAVASFEAPMPWRSEYGTDAGLETLAIGEGEGPAAAAEHFYRAMVGDAVWDRLRAPEREARRAEGPALLGDVAASRRSGETAAEGPIGVAVRSACGTESPARLMWAAGELARLHPASAPGPAGPTRIDGAGHGAHLSHPDRFAAWVRQVAAGSRSHGA